MTGRAIISAEGPTRRKGSTANGLDRPSCGHQDSAQRRRHVEGDFWRAPTVGLNAETGRQIYLRKEGFNDAEIKAVLEARGR